MRIMGRPWMNGPAQALRRVLRAGPSTLVVALLFMAMARDASSSEAESGKVAPDRNAGAGAASDLCSARNAVGVGLHGDYFAEPEWHGARLLSRTDPSVDFDASLDWPPNTPAPRSVRWQGWVKAPIAGIYRFHVDGAPAHVIVARQEAVVADGRVSVPVRLEAGRFYPITIEIARLDAHPRGPLALTWTAPHGARYVVPRALLFLPTETAGTRAARPPG
ncbi:MAG TPA: PA14 domain-containing protein [Caldimonas sp.]|nr:PA14 domain-containing protein [Caldimonas sp.]